MQLTGQDFALSLLQRDVLLRQAPVVGQRRGELASASLRRVISCLASP